MVSRGALMWVALTGTIVLVGALFFRTNHPSEVETLTILGEDASTMQAIEAVKAKFESEREVKVTTSKSAFEVLQQKANADLSSGTGLYDVILNVNSSLSSYVRNGWVFKLAELKKIDPTIGDEAFEKDLFQNTWHEVGF